MSLQSFEAVTVILTCVGSSLSQEEETREQAERGADWNK